MDSLYRLNNKACLTLTTHFCLWKRQIQHQKGKDRTRNSGRAIVCHSLPVSRRNHLTQALVSVSVLLADVPIRYDAHAEQEISQQRRVFFDIAVDGKDFGRIEVELLGSKAKIAEQRFLDLVQGVQGVGYRRSKVAQLLDTYITVGALPSLSYEANGRVLVTGGPTADALEDELDQSNLKHDAAGLVSINVRPIKSLESKDRLVAIDGKFVNVTEVLGQQPNGTGFSITTNPSPELDGFNIIVGKVVGGMGIVEKLRNLPRVKNNTSSPFFQAGKKSGDKRANVAEMSFDRPFSKVIVKNCGAA
ncbi:Peptidyl-prolyl cis-trans isomerase CYP26-2 [Picochlorum sp. SENEW3]|nr:Peptidyl-prolyl cis-trans isomerase CYP26-2 [Picochlorum sp. SENEW3]WPT15943.1 Peptidyl-prolyl cis-trans isomerase CYP26-2 [Picochlorum sp. SENEW3]